MRIQLGIDPILGLFWLMCAARIALAAAELQ